VLLYTYNIAYFTMDLKQIFFLNGQKYCTDKPLFLNELVNYFNYYPNLFVIEYNYKICNQKEWFKIKIQNNDNIEIITIVGGG